MIGIAVIASVVARRRELRLPGTAGRLE
jgi:hypothetical protein